MKIDDQNEFVADQDQLPVGRVPASQKTHITLDKFVVPGEINRTKAGIDQIREVIQIEELRRDFNRKLSI